MNLFSLWPDPEENYFREVCKIIFVNFDFYATLVFNTYALVLIQNSETDVINSFFHLL